MVCTNLVNYYDRDFHTEFHNEFLSFILNIMKNKYAMKLFNLFEKYALRQKP